jgi:tRNA A37 threonylcarbamoyladenosine synthetase subunit TsaC/SUA5/YrdC
MSETDVYLIQTDTTVGFASKDATRLAAIKERTPGKPFLKTLPSLRVLRANSRIPKALRKRVRQAAKTTFVCADGVARRVVREGVYGSLLIRQGWMYSTSANQSGKRFDPAWAESVSDIIVSTPEGFSEKSASAIYRMGKTTLTQLR